MPISIVSIPVTDPGKSKDFYTDITGFTLLREAPMGPDMRWIQLQPKDGGATIALTTWFEALKPGGQTGLMLHVDDIDAEHARLTDLGITLTPIGEQPWGRFTLLEDLDGNGWVIAQLNTPEENRYPV